MFSGHWSVYAPGLQGQGLGKIVWRAALSCLKSEGYHQVSASTSSLNMPVMNLYVQLGFQFPEPRRFIIGTPPARKPGDDLRSICPLFRCGPRQQSIFIHDIPHNYCFRAGPQNSNEHPLPVRSLMTFLFNRNWTFRHDGSLTSSFWKYAFVYLCGYFINWVTLFLLVDIAGWRHQLVQGVTILVIAAFIFVTQKLSISKNRNPFQQTFHDW